MVVQSIFVDPRSSSGGGGGPRLFRLGLEVDDWSREAEDAFSCFSLIRDPFRRPSDGDFESLRKLVDGKISFFCLEAGSISSKSTGTPRETKNSRRIRDRTQFGGCKGGGATSCDHKERLRSVRNIEYFSGSGDDWGEGGEDKTLVLGNNSSRYGLLAAIKSSNESSPLKSSNGLSKSNNQLRSNA